MQKINSRPLPISKDEYARIEQFASIIMTYDVGEENEELKKVVYEVLYRTYRKIEDSSVPKETRAEIRCDYNRIMDKIISTEKLVDHNNVDPGLLIAIKNYSNAIKSLVLYVRDI